MAKILIKVLLLIIPFTHGYGQFIFKIKDNSKKVEIPFELYNNLIVIPVKINGIVPLKFLLDTGVKTTIITEKIYIDVLKPSYNKKVRLTGAVGGEGVDALVVNPLRLDLPGIEGTNQSMLVLEEDYLQLSNNIGVPVHGITGFEIFRRFIVEIDYSNKMLVLHEPDHFKPQKGFLPFPIVIKDTKPYINLDIHLKNRPEPLNAHLMMDTGASNALILGLDSLNQIYLPDTTIFSAIGRGLEGLIQGHLGRVQKVSMGPFQFNKVITSFPSETSYICVLKQTERHGSLGGGIMSRFTVIFDYRKEIVYFKKNKSYKDPFEHNMSGMEIMVQGEKLNNFIIYSVVKGSPAENAGILPGDEIIKMNYRSNHHWTLNEMYALLSSKKGRKIKIKILREGEKQKYNFYLSPII